MKFFQKSSTIKGNIETDINKSESLWTSDAPTMPALPRFQGREKADLAIIGGGVTGLSCAYYAKKMRPDWKVVVLESVRMGSGASSRNSGAVYASYQRGKEHSPFAERGLERLLKFLDTEKIECDLQEISVLEFHGSKKKARKAGAINKNSRWLLADELKKNLDTDYFPNAVEKNKEHLFLDPALLVNGHVEAAQKMGAELYEYSPVTEITPGKPAQLMTPGGRITADRVFIATNAYTPRLGILKHRILPLHHYTLATRKLTSDEISRFGLDRWPLRFEMCTVPITSGLYKNSRFFARIVLGYASFNSCKWKDMEGAKETITKIISKRYPWLSDVGVDTGWHGVTGHTVTTREIASPLPQDNIHVSAAYNGLGIMPGHNNGYLSACRFAGEIDQDQDKLVKYSKHLPWPGEPLRSLIFKPGMRMLMPN